MLVFMPVFIVLLLGMAFLNTIPRNIPVMICDMDNGNLSHEITSHIESLEAFTVTKIQDNCEENIQNAIKSSSVRAGIILPSNLTIDIRSGKQVGIEIIYDNTKPIRNIVVLYFRLISNEFSNKLTREMIGSSWQSLRQTSSEMGRLKNNLETYRSNLASVIGDLKEAQDKAKNLEENFSSTLSNISSVSDNIRNSVQDSEKIYDDINSVKNNLQQSAQSLENLKIVAQTMSSDPETSQYAQSILQNIQNLQENLDSVETSLDSAEAEIRNANQDIDDSLKKLDNTKSEEIGSELESTISEMETTIEFFNQTHEDIILLQEKISSGQELFDTLTSRDPRFVADPVAFSSREAFGELRFIDFLFPSIMIVILMMVSILLPATTLVRDRSSGLLQRILISPTSLKFLIAEKATTSFVISVLQVPIILGIGIFFFGISITTTNIFPILLVSILTILTFVFLGLIIGSLANSESTVMLASMIFIIPMIFLSGALIPPEVMPVFIRNAADLLPLALSSKLLQGIILEGSITPHLFSMIEGMLLYIVLFATATWILMKKSLA